MPLPTNLSDMLEYDSISDADLLKAIERTIHGLSSSSYRHETLGLAFQHVQLAHHIASKLSPERVESVVNATAAHSSYDAKVLIKHAHEIYHVAELINKQKQVLSIRTLTSVNAHYLTNTQFTGIMSVFKAIGNLEPSIVTKISLSALFYSLRQSSFIANELDNVKAIFNTHFNLESYDTEFREDLFKRVIKGEATHHNFLLQERGESSSVVKLILFLIEDSQHSLMELRETTAIVKNIDLNLTALILEDQFKTSPIDSTVTIENIGKIITRLSEATFNTSTALTQRLDIIGNTIELTINNIYAIAQAVNAGNNYRYFYRDSVVTDGYTLSSLTEDSLKTELNDYKNFVKMSKGNQLTISCTNIGFVTQGKLEDVIALYRSRYWVEYVFFLRGLVGTLTDEEVNWALTHTTNSNIQQGAMLFMRTMMSYHVHTQEELVFNDLTATKVILVTGASEGRLPLGKVLEDNYPLSYSMYAVFAEV